MIYWFAAQRDQLSVSRMTRRSSRDARCWRGWSQIAARDEANFELTADELRCRFCTYRSLCRRGQKAGDFLETEAELEAEGEFALDFDFDQIAEIEF
jgi:hypothetical protein